jgi:hypothetical protein
MCSSRQTEFSVAKLWLLSPDHAEISIVQPSRTVPDSSFGAFHYAKFSEPPLAKRGHSKSSRP